MLVIKAKEKLNRILSGWKFIMRNTCKVQDDVRVTQ